MRKGKREMKRAKSKKERQNAYMKRKIETLFFIRDGCSFHYANIWSKSGMSICWRHLVRSKESSNAKNNFGKGIFRHTCVTCSELPSCISTMEQAKGRQERLFLAFYIRYILCTFQINLFPSWLRTRSLI